MYTTMMSQEETYIKKRGQLRYDIYKQTAIYIYMYVYVYIFIYIYIYATYAIYIYAYSHMCCHRNVFSKTLLFDSVCVCVCVLDLRAFVAHNMIVDSLRRFKNVSIKRGLSMSTPQANGYTSP